MFQLMKNQKKNQTKKQENKGNKKKLLNKFSRKWNKKKRKKKYKNALCKVSIFKKYMKNLKLKKKQFINNLIKNKKNQNKKK